MPKGFTVAYKKRRNKITLQQAMASVVVKKEQSRPLPIIRVFSPKIERPFCQQMAASVFPRYNGWPRYD